MINSASISELTFNLNVIIAFSNYEVKNVKLKIK